MRVLITGAKGMLGMDLTDEIIKDGHIVKAYGRDKLDICDLDSVIKEVEKYNPDVVINTAAYTYVDKCEIDTNSAYKVNSIGPKNLAIACNKQNCALVHISTDYIFDGETDKPYLENDFPKPLNVYGKSKLFGEENIKNHTNKFFIIRTQWLFGKHGKNFVKTMLSLAENGKPITVVNDQFGSPTYTKDLAAVICKLIKTSAYGTYHVTNTGVCSWYEFAKDIMELTNINADIKPCSTEELNLLAKRPKYSVLENSNLELCGFEKLRSFKDAISDYLKE